MNSFGIGFEVEKILSENEKTFVALGFFNGRKAILKKLLSDNKVWVEKYKTEIEVYKNFKRSQPNFNAPNFLHEGDGLFIYEFIAGDALSTSRYGLNKLADDVAEKLIEAVCMVGEYQPQIKDNLRIYDYKAKLDKYLQSGDISEKEYKALVYLLAECHDPAQFNNGDMLLKNVILQPCGDVAIIDWEFAGIYCKGFDLALLHTTLLDNEYMRQAIALKAKEFEKEFLLNKAIVTIRELRLHKALPEGDNLKNRVMPHLLSEWQEVQKSLANI